MTKKQRALEIIERLKKEYPDAGCTLDYDQAWKLLVSVRLAAQCTDARVNIVVEKLYEKFPDVDAKDITPDIWERVGKGESLTEIWLEKENNRLKMEQAAAAQNAENAGRATGSMASSGGETEKKDPFDEGWD